MRAWIKNQPGKVPGSTIVEASFKAGLYATAPICLLLLPFFLSIAPMVLAGLLVAVEVAIACGLFGAIMLVIGASGLNALGVLGPIPLAVLLCGIPYAVAFALLGPGPDTYFVLIEVAGVNITAGLIPFTLMMTGIFFFVLRRKLAEMYD
jgi:hypothetical protein